MSTKKAAPAKKAAKKAPKLKPLRLQGQGIQLGGDRLAELFFITYPAKALNDLLRQRQLGIPKEKAEAARRLATWATRESARFDLFLA
jgi:hypothetical protein